jgi:hypothetical protein
MPGVVGVAIVDESVFSIAEQEPGFARSYFLIDRALQEPRYGLHDYTDLGDADSPYDGAPNNIQFASRARQLALAGLFAHELAARASRRRRPVRRWPPHPRRSNCPGATGSICWRRWLGSRSTTAAGAAANC